MNTETDKQLDGKIQIYTDQSNNSPSDNSLSNNSSNDNNTNPKSSQSTGDENVYNNTKFLKTFKINSYILK